MGEHQYINSETADAAERERLSLLEQTADPLSQRRLAALGIQPGWRCLEVGAGHGSIVRWLAEQVGPQGRVICALSMQFAPDQGPQVFEPLGWRTVSATSVFKTAGRLKRLRFPMSLLWRLPGGRYGTPGFPWMGVGVLEPAPAPAGR